MTKKNNKNNKDKEIWSRKFEDNEDNENNKNSRLARKKTKDGISPMAMSLFIFLALLIILPTATVLWYMNESNDREGFKADDDEITVTQNSSSKESSSEIKESSSEIKESSSEIKDSFSEETSTLEIPAKSESKEEDEVVEEAPEQIVPEEEVPETPVEPEFEEPEPAPAPEPEIEEPAVEETGNTYTVVAGDNLYRIAKNHGMTTEQLKTLNGLSGNEVSIGTVLKVN